MGQLLRGRKMVGGVGHREIVYVCVGGGGGAAPGGRGNRGRRASDSTPIGA